ncbi:MAG: hypothetical protein H7210_12615 [Pyrinomonadaceae bacterium]|nr:hypothetical protein [Phycisphaerales bacterium]
MAQGPPQLIAIDHDDYHAQHVGRTADGRQFFLTTPFEPAIGADTGNEFVALFLFDSSGNLLEARIEEFGAREEMDDEKLQDVYSLRLHELGEVSFERIQVAPFSVERFGTRFGLIPCPPEDEGDSWHVELHPGNYMAFSEPWDSGEYDT